MKERNMGLECLRIFSMFLIILLHSIDHSGLLESLVPGTALYVWERLYYALCQVCVNCFVMLSGYFLAESKFRLSKLVMLWAQVVFYSLGIKLILMASGQIPFSATSLVSCFVPVLTGRYWFVTIYFGLYLLFPFLNVLIRGLTRRSHGVLCLLLFVLMSGMISVHPAFAGMNSGGGWGLAWFVTLYLMAAWLRKYGVPGGGKYGVWYALGYLGCGAAMFLGALTAQWLGVGVLQSVTGNWHRYDSVFTLLGSVCLFCAFTAWEDRREKRGCPKWIAKLSGATFGVYLIHAHANICIPEFWQDLGILSFSGRAWFPAYQVLLVAAIFLICVAVEMARQKLFSYLPIERWVTKKAAVLDALWNEDTEHE